jgi:WD40 repeat protein
MSMPRSLLFGVLILALVPLPAPGAEGAPPEEPLPPGAAGRLGSARFRMPSAQEHAALSPDGQVLAIREGSDSLLLLDPRTGKVRKRLAAQLMGRALCFTPDGKKLVSYDAGRVTAVDLLTGSQQEWTQPGPADLATPRFSADGKTMAAGFLGFRKGGGKNTSWAEAALSADGKRLASWGSVPDREGRDKNRIIQIWDVAGGKEVGRIHLERAGIYEATFSPDGKHLAVIETTPMRMVSVWELATGKRIRRFAARRDTYLPLVYSPDGTTLAAGSFDGSVQMWDLTTGKRLAVVRGPKCRLLSLALTGKGRGLAMGANHQTLHVWELPTGKMYTPLAGHQGTITSLTFLDGGRILASGGEDGLYWWDLASGKTTRRRLFPSNERYHRKGQYTWLLFSPDGRHLAGFPDDRDAVCFLDPETLLELFAVRSRFGPYRVPTTSFSREGSFALVREVYYDRGTSKLLLTVWDVDRAEAIRDVEVGPVDGPNPALSPDGRLVAVVNNSDRPQPRAEWLLPRTLGIWEVATGKSIATLGIGEEYIRHLAFVPDGKSLLAVGRDGGLWAWEAGSGDWAALEKGFRYPTSHVAFSPDGRTFALAGTPRPNREGEVGVWELATGKLRVRYHGHRGRVNALAFSPDGRLLASGGTDTTVLLWDLLRRPDKEKPAGDLEALWKALNDPDPVRGHRALLRLLADPEQAVALFSRRLKPEAVKELSEAEVAALIADLDADTFAQRERAAKALAKAGKQVEGALKAALASKPGLEKHRRLEELLKRLAGGRRAPERVGPRRALEVLERLGTPSAQRLLQKLSKARPRTWLSEEAADSLRRLRARR